MKVKLQNTNYVVVDGDIQYLLIVNATRHKSKPQSSRSTLKEKRAIVIFNCCIYFSVNSDSNDDNIV